MKVRIFNESGSPILRDNDITGDITSCRTSMSSVTGNVTSVKMRVRKPSNKVCTCSVHGNNLIVVVIDKEI